MSPETSPELINVAGLAKALAVHLQSALPVTKRVMNVEDAAEYCGLPRESFKKKVVRDRIPKVRFDKCWRFDKADLDAWIDSHKEQIARETYV
jgi:excisionase family DNA binding protein